MKVLIAENNERHLSQFKTFLEEENYTVIAANNSEKALALWKEEMPNVLIIDLNMPDRSGLDVIESIRKQEESEHTYIIVATDENDQVLISEKTETGIDDYLLLPIRKTELIYRLKASQKNNLGAEEEQVIYALAQLTETRDVETGKHLERIGLYSKVIALELQKDERYQNIITPTFINHLSLSSVLHDIGKVGIEDIILRKQGIYSEEERKKMQLHTLIGSKTLENIYDKYPLPFLKMATRIARSHHEKWDGSGYPDGLNGEDIPLCARIVAIADVFDALISERYYKPKYSFEESRRIIVESSGSHFDPVIVEAFLKNQDKFLLIMCHNSLLEA